MWTRYTEPQSTLLPVLPPDSAQTTRLSTSQLPADIPADEDILVPAADPDFPAVLTPMQSYLAILIRPLTENRESWIGGSCPPGWEWVQPTEYEVSAGHIRIAALKATVEHGLAPYLVGPYIWLAVRWAGYTQPTFYVNAAWLHVRCARLERYVAAGYKPPDR